MIPAAAAQVLLDRTDRVMVHDVCAACGEDWQGVTGKWVREPDNGDPGMKCYFTNCCKARSCIKEFPDLSDEQSATRSLRERRLLPNRTERDKEAQAC